MAGVLESSRSIFEATRGGKNMSRKKRSPRLQRLNIANAILMSRIQEIRRINFLPPRTSSVVRLGKLAGEIFEKEKKHV
jgi:hypothetical protein